MRTVPNSALTGVGQDSTRRLFLSRDHVMQYVAVDIRQPEIAARVAIGEARVIEAHEMKDRGVEVVDVSGILSRRVTVLVGNAEAESTLRATAGQEAGETTAV